MAATYVCWSCHVPRPRPVLRAAALVALAGLAVGCAGDPTTVTPSASAPAASVTPTVTATPTAVATSTLPPGVDQLLSFTFRNGAVVGPKGRVKVRLGSTLRIVVTSDVADEVHVHAYDKLVDVAAGGTVQVTFKATIPGVIKVELEKSAVTLVSLQIQ